MIRDILFINALYLVEKVHNVMSRPLWSVFKAFEIFQKTFAFIFEQFVGRRTNSFIYVNLLQS